MGVDALLQRGTESNGSSNFGEHQDTWGWLHTDTEPYLTFVTLLSPVPADSASGVRLVGSHHTFMYGATPGSTAVFSSAAWHSSIPGRDHRPTFKLTVFIGFCDAVGLSFDAVAAPLNYVASAVEGQCATADATADRSQCASADASADEFPAESPTEDEETESPVESPTEETAMEAIEERSESPIRESPIEETAMEPIEETRCLICLEDISGEPGSRGPSRWGWTLCCHALLHSQCLSSWVQSGGVEVRCPTESDDTYSKAIAKHRCPKCNSPMPTSRVLQSQPLSASGLPPDVMDLSLPAVTQLDTADSLLPPTSPNTAGSCRDVITTDGDLPRNTLDSSNSHTDPASDKGSSCDGPGNQPDCNH